MPPLQRCSRPRTPSAFARMVAAARVALTRGVPHERGTTVVRPAASIVSMTISVVLRLALPALREGRLAGQLEIVEDGTRVVIRDADELVDVVRRHVAGGADDAPPIDPGAPARA